MIEILRQIVLSLVEYPDALSLAEKSDQQHITFLVTVKAGDEARLIGKGGKTINAIRTVLKAMNTSPRRVSVRITTRP